MTVRASKLLGWRRTENRRVHKFGIFKNVMTSDGTSSVPIVAEYDESCEMEYTMIGASYGRAIDAIFLKRAQMSQ